MPLPELTAQAERAVRRGDMAEAIRLYEQQVAADPSDTHAAEKLAKLKESLQPMELMNPKARAPVVPTQLSPEQEGERLFNVGDHLGAAKVYREALRARPDSQLLRERLVEIVSLIQEQAPATASAVAPRPARTSAPPRTPEETLEILLERITRRRRS